MIMKTNKKIIEGCILLASFALMIYIMQPMNVHGIDSNATLSGDYTLSFQGFDYNGAGEVSIFVNGLLLSSVPTVYSPQNINTTANFSFNISDKVTSGSNTVIFWQNPNYSSAVQNFEVTGPSGVVYSNSTFYTMWSGGRKAIAYTFDISVGNITNTTTNTTTNQTTNVTTNVTINQTTNVTTNVTSNVTNVTNETNQTTGNVSVTNFDYIVVIVMENHSLNEIVPSATFMTSLANNYSQSTGYTAVHNTSLPNYLALLSGQTWGCNGLDNKPNSTPCTVDAWNSVDSNLVNRLEAAGLTWKAYMEDMPVYCYTDNSGNYSVVHNPFAYFNDIVSNTTRCNQVAPAGVNDLLLLYDLNSTSTASNFMWLTPDVYNNMHNSTVAFGDNYLSVLVPKILNSTIFKTEKAALFITFDEHNGSQTQMYTVFAGPAVRESYKSSTPYNHYSFLKTIEDNWKLANLTSNDGEATPMTEFFKASVKNETAPNVTNMTGLPLVYIVEPKDFMNYGTLVPLVYNVVNGTSCSYNVDNGTSYTVPCKYSTFMELLSGRHTVNVTGSNNIGSVSATRTFNIVTPIPEIKLQKFAGSTTNMTNLSALQNASIILHMPNFGKIEFLQTIDFSSSTLSSTIPSTPYIINWQGWDYDAMNELTVVVNNQNVTKLSQNNTPGNDQKYAPFSLDITNFTKIGTNTISFIQNSGESKLSNVTIIKSSSVMYRETTETYMWSGGISNVGFSFDASPLFDIDSAVDISSGRISIDSDRFPWLNKSAKITFEDIFFNSPVLFKDGVVCDVCQIVSHDRSAGTITYIVPGFSTYTVQETGSQTPASTGSSSSGGGGVTIYPEDQANLTTQMNETNETTNVTVGGNVTTPSCVENWTCSDWSTCASGTQTRNCFDLNYCNTNVNQPSTMQNCTEQNVTGGQITVPTGYSIYGLGTYEAALLAIIAIIIVGGTLYYYYYMRGPKTTTYHRSA